jgi:hypothetical protein
MADRRVGLWLIGALGGVGSTVAVYMDESPFGSSTALLNGSILTGDFDTWDLQRVEVLRGPQGTLYGANSEGGLLKFVTTAPVLGSFSGAAEATDFVPVAPPAPGRFSITTFWPQASVSFCARMRPSVSMVPPAGNAISNRTGRSG